MIRKRMDRKDNFVNNKEEIRELNRDIFIYLCVCAIHKEVPDTTIIENADIDVYLTY